MLKCNNCGEELVEGKAFCPACGKQIESEGFEPAQAETVEPQEGQAEQAASEPAEVDSVETADAEESIESEGKKSKKGVAIAAISVAAVAIIAVCVYFITQSGAGGAVVATAGGNKLTNAELSYYYWGEYFYLENYYAQYGMSISDMLDTSVGLADQPFVNDEWPTWHDYFFETAAENWRNTLAIYTEAVKNGHVMDAERTAALQDLKDQLAAEAETYNYDSVEAMLREDYGQFASYDGYREYLEMQYLAYSYVFEVYNGLKEKYSANLETIPSVSVRHILLSFAANGDDAKQMADTVYADWKTVGTEEYFSRLAGEHSNDPGSQGFGGLYEGVAPGDMVTEFNDWCFDESRKVGDTGIVETTYGYHIMYYSGNGEPVTKNPADQTAADEAASAEYSDWIDELVAKLGEYTSTVSKANTGK